MKQMTFPALAAAAFFLAPALAGAQAPPPSPAPTQAPAAAPMASEQRAAKAETAKGELVKVDADAKNITIKGADGVETVFAYTDATEVAGRDGVAGLATKAGTKVTVHFLSNAGTKTATKIEVAGAADAAK
jgi:Cu/Ag efflux protein CusF